MDLELKTNKLKNKNKLKSRLFKSAITKTVNKSIESSKYDPG